MRQTFLRVPASLREGRAYRNPVKATAQKRGTGPSGLCWPLPVRPAGGTEPVRHVCCFGQVAVGPQSGPFADLTVI